MVEMAHHPYGIDGPTKLHYKLYISDMPTEYQRKNTTSRGQWSGEHLKAAIAAIQNNKIEIRASARHYNIPAPILRCRLKKKDFVKRGLGPSSALGIQNEEKLKPSHKKAAKTWKEKVSHLTQRHWAV
jgi:helix-turn-helix, Psq domain